MSLAIQLVQNESINHRRGRHKACDYRSVRSRPGIFTGVGSVDTKSCVNEGGGHLCDGPVVGGRDGMREGFESFARKEAEQEASVWFEASGEPGKYLGKLGWVEVNQ